MHKKTKAEQFCEGILQLNLPHSKALANLVMSLSSFTNATSVVSLSESVLFQHQYSSINDAIAHFAECSVLREQRKKEIQQLCLQFFPKQEIYDFHSDGVSLFREHSECLKERIYAHKANNVIAKNKPVGIGYQYSLVNLGVASSGWSLLFGTARVEPSRDLLGVSAKQISNLLRDEELPFKEAIVANVADSQYGTPKYLSPTAGIPNLINIIRLRHGIKVYRQERKSETGGAPQIYGEKFYLIEESDKKTYKKKAKSCEIQRRAVTEIVPDEEIEIFRFTSKGRHLRIRIRRWTKMMLRSKNGYSMKEVVLDLVGITVFDAVTKERVYKHDTFLSVTGLMQARLSLEEIFDKFRHRFDIEVTNRFCKQKLLLDSYQTPELKHFENWVLIVGLSLWLLFCASDEVENVCKKWQQYSEPKRVEGERKSPSQTHKAAERLFLTFEKAKFQPKKSKKGIGRRVGEIQEKRESYKVMKKGKKVVLKRSQIELQT